MNEHVAETGRSAFARRMTGMDALIAEFGRSLQVLGGGVHAGRPNPAGRPDPDAEPLTDPERRHAAGLMRVNHVGEVCAQALYRGQALLCRDERARHIFHEAAAEEVDHLAWCDERLRELQSRPSYLNPLWYAASFGMGVLAGVGGAGRNLGFMAETEAQVEQHLESHLKDLPVDDQRSRRIVEQMRDDEARHRHTAQEEGGQAMPGVIRKAMRFMSRVMTTTAYRL